MFKCLIIGIWALRVLVGLSYKPNEAKVLTTNNWQATIVKINNNFARVIDKNGHVVYLRVPKSYEIGYQIYCKSQVLTRVHQLNNPGSLQHNVTYSGKLNKSCTHLQLDSYVWRIRRSINKLIVNKPIIRSIVLGSVVTINKDIYAILQNTGTLHLIAISGLHIGCFMRGAQYLLSRLTASFFMNKLYGQLYIDIASVCISYLYALVAGGSSSAYRACLMAFLAIGARGLFWPTSKYFGLVIAFVTLSFIKPACLIMPGFWLSFVGVFVLFVNDFQSFMQGVVMFCVMAIMSAFFFNVIALSAIFANVIAIPVFSFWVVPLSLFGSLVSFVNQDLAQGVWQLAQYGVDILWPVLKYLSQYGVLHISYTPFYCWMLAFIGMVIFLLFANWPLSWVALLWAIPLLFTSFTEKINNGHFSTTVLDVGQGLSVVIKTAEHTLVYDAGPKFAGEKIIQPYLYWAGIKHIDTMIISHGDLDHKGGANFLFINNNIAKVLSSEPARLIIPAQVCHTGQNWVWDGVAFQILSPPPQTHWQGNRASCVLLVKGSFGTVLLPGDIDINTEKWLLDHFTLSITGLVVPHHGSKTSSSLSFLRKIQPAWAVISSGYNNYYHLPDPSIVKRYKDNSIMLYNTQAYGSVHKLT